METANQLSRGETMTRFVWLLFLHQFVSTLGIIVVAPPILEFGLDVLRLVSSSFQAREYGWILIETPYFPVQIILALTVGWLVSGYLRHRSMLWVWVIPFVILCGAVVAYPRIGQITLARFAEPSTASSLSHFFGWGCQPRNACLDQVLITLPFYSSAAYSIGAFLARKLGHASTLVEFLSAVNLKRAIVFIGLPCFVIKLAGAWSEVSGYEYLRTAEGMFNFILLGLIESTIFVSLLLFGVHLISRHFTNRQER